MKTLTDQMVSRVIVGIRAGAGGDVGRCPTCCRPAEEPYRRVIEGAIREGCVDASHLHLIGETSESAAWHNRPEAQDMRMRELTRLKDAFVRDHSTVASRAESR
jgi:hypothetical protein